MPQLNVETPSPYIKRLFLPSTANMPQDEQAWVRLDVSPDTVGDLQAWSDDDANSVTRSIRILASRIKEWNFTDQNKAPVAISFENVCHMSAVDLRYLLRVPYEKGSGELSLEDKKK